MKRKLVKQGAATMMISLPSKWIKENGLDKGDEIELIEQGGELLIKSRESQEHNNLKINLSGFHPLTNQIVIASYIKGIDELEILFDNREDMKNLKKHVIEDLLGFEIIKQTQTSLVIKSVAEAAKQEIDEILKRIFFILDSMAEELLIAIENKQDASPVIEMDSSVNKFVYFCLRNLNINGYKEYNKTTQIYGIASLLEEIGDIYKQIAKSLQNKIKIEKSQIKILQDIKESLKLFSELLFGFNKETAVKFANNYESIKKRIKGKNSVDSFLYQLNEVIIRMNNYLLVNAFN
ncbi:MAG TPA: AbrB/MazE/SpoVT family DNA-binding domain-containing protein [Candidatus Nanoarchaeia archaeon]|nr:AbrB/MazE/SpoVT family DNA-binding domain-containing protein [Candidatus Nanoarchaeia archaeon]